MHADEHTRRPAFCIFSLHSLKCACEVLVHASTQLLRSIATDDSDAGANFKSLAPCLLGTLVDWQQVEWAAEVRVWTSDFFLSYALLPTCGISHTMNSMTWT